VGEKEWAAPSIRVEAAANVFGTFGAILCFRLPYLFAPGTTPPSPEQAEALLPRLISWRDQGNLYLEGIDLLRLGGPKGLLKPTRERKSLADWQAFWGAKDPDSLQGRIRYEGGNLSRKATAVPEQVRPEDFRLHPDSAGYRAGPDGHDLGADVELIGPGPAYERWQKTPAYQRWLKELGVNADKVTR
jgi:hypothetical protein